MTTLRNGPALSDKELDKWCYHHVPQYKGTINKNDFAKLYPTMIPGDSCIINLDPDYENGGTHWTAIRVSSEGPIVYYKDSFGVAPPQIVVDTVNSHGQPPKGLVFGDLKYQQMKESNCGYRAAMFLRSMSYAGKNNKEIEYFKKFG